VSMSDDAWKWLKTAPLPVVLALTLPAGAFLTAKQVAMATEQAKQGERVENVKKDQEAVKAQIEKANDKLDKLLEAVLRLQAELEASRAKDGAGKDGRTKGGKKP